MDSKINRTKMAVNLSYFDRGYFLKIKTITVNNYTSVLIFYNHISTRKRFKCAIKVLFPITHDNYNVDNT